MALVTMARLRSMLGEVTGFYYAGINTGTATDTVVDAELERWDTGRLTDRWVMMLAGNNVGKSRRISSVSTSTATMVSAWAAANASGDTFDIYPYDPGIMEYAIQEAVRNVWPKPVAGRGAARGLYRRAVEYIVVDNLLSSPFFETSESTGAITAYADYDSTVEGTTLVTDAAHGLSTGDWTTISGSTSYNGLWQVVVVSSDTFYIRTPFIADDGASTWVEGDTSQEGTASGWTATSGTWTFPRSTRAWIGNHVATAAGAATLTQDIFSQVNIQDAVGKLLHIRGALRSPTTGIARLRVSFDGGSTFAASSRYHSGGGDFEGPDKQSIDIAIPSGATTTTIYCDVASGATPSFGLVVAWIDPVVEYPLLETYRQNGPNFVHQQVYEDQPEGLYLPLTGYAIAGRLLRLEGAAPLTVPTSDTMSVEADELEAGFIIAEAAARMFGILKNVEPELRAEHAAEEASWQRTADDRRMGVGRAVMGADWRSGWRVSEDAPQVLRLDR